MGGQNCVSAAARLQEKLPPPLHLLVNLAFNFWWSWSPEVSSLFRVIDPKKWEEYDHNPVKLLNRVSFERLTQLSTEPYYCSRILVIAAQLEQYKQKINTWGSQFVPQFNQRQPIVYFSMEFGLHECLPTYSSGLGILAADYLKSASDLGLPIVGVSLIYHQSYSQQLDASSLQKEIICKHQLDELPLELCKKPNGECLTVTVPISDRIVKAQVWLARVGRVNLYLLDTNRQDNDPIDRKLTNQLYGGSRGTRIAQECLLGIGGVKLLQRLRLEPQVYHLNESHAAFALLELARWEMERTGQSFEEVKASVRSRCVFTTHTPVPAGHDTFSVKQMDRYFSHYWFQLGLDRREFLNLGNHSPEKFGLPFNMTVLALRLCGTANGVSKLNGQVCREMWSILYRDRPVEKVPIGHVTNGVHVRTWTAPLMANLYAQYLSEDWMNHVTDAQMWARIDEIPDREFWWRHQRLKEHLIAFTRSHVRQVRERRSESSEVIAQADSLLDPKALTIGFARCFSTYKRGDLILHDPEKVRAILTNASRPVQMIIAGKAHPADEESKRIIQRLISFCHHSDLQNRLLFIEDYNMQVAKKLVQGVDVWLHNPERPQEASGTSGQKVILNGGINCSVLDGWWYEVYQASPDGKGINGWAIGKANSTDSREEQNQEDVEALYKLLEEEIIPCYYEQDDEGIPRRWIEMMKASIKTIAPYFNTDRMVAEYVQKMYLSQYKAGVELAISKTITH
ncbi:alpha-glucan family phosphorylase [Scytonema sp. UIC 10036]|uniref:alpha-glucan family phosphorylase n=1 Tax=Scytonema sp. UIC 10036 TaxID=2304196 RepID=UPI0012DA64AF|nr:alpha-glucan family phosphorylase [Scytonema sp. UIC 10036]MUG94480.1 alpha-glucan family phosphorylase [Scytonema sp. UIC 10036]